MNFLTAPQKNTSNSAKLIIVVSVICFLKCSAYFNTYYNADLAFREAYTAHKKILKQYPDSIVVTPPDEISSKYERVIEKTIKVLDAYSKRVKWHDDALFLMGKAYFYKKMMPRAIGRFQQLQKEFPSSPFIAESYLFMAKAYIETGDLVKAEDLIHMILEKYPHLNKEQSISLLLVDISLRREGRAQAIAILEKALKSAKNEEVRLDLLLRVSVLYIELNQYDRAVSILESAPRKKKFPLKAYKMDKALVECYIKIDSLQKALNLCDKMYSNGKNYQYIDNILFQKGLILEKMGRIEEAIEVYSRITAGIDSSNVASDTSSIAAKAFYQLALIYQKKLKDYNKAENMFTMASKMKDSTCVANASKRLSAMEKLRLLREENDSLKTERKFKAGELFLFELNEPDSAYNQFMSSISNTDDIDSAYVPKALCMAAIVARDGLNDTARADSILRIVLDTYPSSEFAKKAQQELDIPVTVKTKEDSALGAYRDAEKMLYSSNADVKGAVQAFYDVYINYPEMDIAPKSLFAAAWAADVILQKNVTAKSLYEKICEKYPESEYCTQEARPRLKIVMDTLSALENRTTKVNKKSNTRPPKSKNTKKELNSKDTVSVDNIKKDSLTAKETDIDSLIDSTQLHSSDSTVTQGIADSLP